MINKSYQVVSVEKLREHPRNPNKGNVDAISESIRVNGFFGACVVQQSSGYVLAGNHRFKAAKKAGLKEIPAIYVDVDDVAAHRIMVADNQTARLGSDDPEKLLSLLQEIERDSGSLLGTGYDPGSVDRLLGELTGPKEFVFPTDPNPSGEGGTPGDGSESYGVPLAIILDPGQLDRWRALRKMRKCKTDTGVSGNRRKLHEE